MTCVVQKRAEDVRLGTIMLRMLLVQGGSAIMKAHVVRDNDRSFFPTSRKRGFIAEACTRDAAP